MKILQVFNQYLEPGGEEDWVNQMLSIGEGSYSIDDLRFRSDDWVGRSAPSKLRQASLLWNNPQARALLRNQVEIGKPDALLFHNLIPVASLGMYDEAAKLGLPVIQYIHNFRPFSPSGTLWLRDRVNSKALKGNPWPEVFSRNWEKSFFKTFIVAVQQKRLLTGCALDVVKRWIAVSDFMRDRFIEAGIPSERVVSLRHCWKAKPEIKTAPEGRYYLFLGRMVAEKGIRVLFDAWRILEKQLGPSCPRLIIAGVGSLEAQAHAWASRMDRVTCVGFVTGSVKDDLVMSCRAVIAPSVWWEPLGLIVHEAYDCARPVLAARSGGLNETVFQGVTGLLHEPGNSEQLANDVERLEALCSTGRAEMGQRGREWLVQKASPEEWSDRFATIVHEAIRK